MNLTGWLILASAVFFIVGLVGFPAILICLPADYFVRELYLRPQHWNRHPAIRFLWLGVKNILGSLLFCAGVVMIFTPGQGLLGMLAGICLMDFPGKRALQQRIISRPGILPALNALRARFNRPPLLKPDTAQNKNSK